MDKQPTPPVVEQPDAEFGTYVVHDHTSCEVLKGKGPGKMNTTRPLRNAPPAVLACPYAGRTTTSQRTVDKALFCHTVGKNDPECKTRGPVTDATVRTVVDAARLAARRTVRSVETQAIRAQMRQTTLCEANRLHLLTMLNEKNGPANPVAVGKS
jgi:hypothetical protein